MQIWGRLASAREVVPEVGVGDGRAEGGGTEGDRTGSGRPGAGGAERPGGAVEGVLAGGADVQLGAAVVVGVDQRGVAAEEVVLLGRAGHTRGVLVEEHGTAAGQPAPAA